MATKGKKPSAYDRAVAAWLAEEARERFNMMYCTTFCNFAHRLGDGKPVEHECYILPPAALEAEMQGDYEEAHRLLAAAPRIVHRGLRRGAKRQ